MPCRLAGHCCHVLIAKRDSTWQRRVLLYHMINLNAMRFHCFFGGIILRVLGALQSGTKMTKIASQSNIFLKKQNIFYSIAQRLQNEYRQRFELFVVHSI